jgi:hypothetical protein
VTQVRSPQSLFSGSSCNSIDWYEVGRRDGSLGHLANLVQDYQDQCKGAQTPPAVDVYLNGREAGLTEYCTSQNGFEIGRMGREYRHVCPENLEAKFLNGYRRGLKLHSLESQNSASTAPVLFR